MRRSSALAATRRTLLGTSHRQAPVRRLVGDVKVGLHSCSTYPTGYEVVLGNGGSTLFWDVAVCSLIRQRSAHASFGEFSAKFAAAAAAASTSGCPVGGHCSRRLRRRAGGGGGTRTSTPGRTTRPPPAPSPPSGAWPGAADDALVVVDGTSAAGGTLVDVAETDVYYFAPQKSLGSYGGLWFALLSPRGAGPGRRDRRHRPLDPGLA